ncbi:type III PLP-dependent enzyme [Pseudonocardia eucalypti]|uniref:ornithine decarboxylase n=1 Tax=Pseudonocardia eucalypti TaxID=648755 RepID=A0ABP9QTV2_9PSEU|nr:ornithine decarboxylase [Pseudonocardia eucalypti]
MSGPYLEMDLGVVRARYAELREALPEARVFYAVKANPEPAVLRALAEAGSGFDVASPGEIALLDGLAGIPVGCQTGRPPETGLAGVPAGRQTGRPTHAGFAGERCYANPVRKPAEVAAAAAAGVRLFVTDSAEDLRVLAANAPGAAVLVRIAVDEAGSATPFGGKFGCAEEEAVRLLQDAARHGLDPAGVGFHVGSQQTRPAAWADAIAGAARVAGRAGMPIRLLDVGGGFPVPYREPVPGIAEYAEVIRDAVRRHFPGRAPELAVEPGRLLVAEAGTLHAEVVRVSRRHDGRRWVYLDIGRYGGLAETEGEAIGYRLATPHDGGPVGPAVLAGPTCDGDDMLYREVPLPLALRAGDPVRLLAAGAYTASYASVGFNGLPPLPVRCTEPVAAR